MTGVTRREFLETSVSAAVFGLPGWSALANGELLGTVAFVEEGRSPIGTLIAGSHQGRLVLDLETLTGDTLVTLNDAFFIRTRFPDGLHPKGGWTIETGGHVREPKWTLFSHTGVRQRRDDTRSSLRWTIRRSGRGGSIAATTRARSISPSRRSS